MPNFNDEYKKIRRRLAENKISKDLADYEAAKLNAWSSKLKSQWRASSPEINVTSLIVAEDYKQLVEHHEAGVLKDHDFLRECSKLLALCEAVKMQFPGPKTLVDDININFVSGALLSEFADEYDAGQPQDPGMGQPQQPMQPQNPSIWDDGDGEGDEYDELEDEDEFGYEENDGPSEVGSVSAGGITLTMWTAASGSTYWVASDEQHEINSEDGDELFDKFVMQYAKAASMPLDEIAAEHRAELDERIAREKRDIASMPPGKVYTYYSRMTPEDIDARVLSYVIGDILDIVSDEMPHPI